MNYKFLCKAMMVTLLSVLLTCVFGVAAYHLESKIIERGVNSQDNAQVDRIVKGLSERPEESWAHFIESLGDGKSSRIRLYTLSDAKPPKDLFPWVVNIDLDEAVEQGGHYQLIGSMLPVEEYGDIEIVEDINPSWQLGYSIVYPQPMFYLGIGLLIGIILVSLGNVFLLKLFTEDAEYAKNKLSLFLEEKGTLPQLVDQVGISLDKYVRESQFAHEHWRDLLHAIAHEIRSPLNRLRFAIDEILSCMPHVADSVSLSMPPTGSESSTDGVDTHLPVQLSKAEREELAEAAEQAIEDISNMVSELLQYSRLELGATELAFMEVELAPLLEGILSKMQMLFTQTKFGINCDLKAMVCDVRLLEYALTNLIRNAAQYGQGVVDIHCYSQATSMEDKKEDIIFVIEDNGCGIAPGKRDRVFEPFTRLDLSRTSGRGNVGLGLSIVKSVADNHSGSIKVSDSDLGGARFELLIPQSK